ncbi:MAG TPA: acyl-CoA dehydrogenase family protein [Bryobacteraceae bacterium]|jgi:alkylation response protein AidB-like acyl-CoA dehydrogenase|nr:acyl-CoA dehydrogenase family protein [Bryobacteraceae bacterium]
MDLNLNPQETKFRDELAAWLKANVPADWEARRLRDTMHERFQFLRVWQKRVYEAGWAGVAWPKEYGGRGASLMEQVIFTQEMAKAGAPPLANVLGLALIGPTIVNYGTAAQKKRYLANILSGDEIWCQGFSEPNAGSDLAGLRTEARLEGDHYIINGQKIWNSYGWAADWCALVTRSDPGSQKHKGLSYLLVDMKSPGVEVRPLRQLTGESEFTELFFRDVKVPAENVLGTAGDGWNVALGTLAHERATLGFGAQIAMRNQLDRLVHVARGLEKTCDPLVRQKLAQSYVENEVVRLNHMRAVSKIIQTGAPGPEGSILKLGWSEANQRFQLLAQEILGPYGQITGGDLATDNGAFTYSYLRTRGNTIEAGTSEVQRNIIGQHVLGLPKSY